MGDEKVVPSSGFGNRRLEKESAVYNHNAWDEIEWSDEMVAAAEREIFRNSTVKVSEEKQEEYDKEAHLFWDKFYQMHQNNFFKDRHWIFTQFPELLPKHPDLVVREASERCKEPTSKADTSDVSNQPTLSSANSKKIIFEVGCGVGNAVFPILQANDSKEVFMYCCDFSEVAISLVQKNPDFDLSMCHPFVLDITSEAWDVPFSENSLDYVTLIFVLSAIHPNRFESVVKNLAKYLKPGGKIIFRDYGKYDMAQLRFKPGQCLLDSFYVRGDGTRAYFFTEEEVAALFAGAGLLKESIVVTRRLQVNRGRRLKMYRIWVQAVYTKLCE